MNEIAKNVSEYIGQFPPEIQKGLNELRDLIRAEAPEAEEKISYHMPAYHLNGPLVYFGAFKDHYGLFPAGAELKNLEKKFAPYRTGKGTLSFPLDEPFPLELIRQLIRLRKEQNVKQANKKAKSK